MKFYDYPVAPNPRRAGIFIREKGLEIETITINLMEKEQFSENFKAINPRCTVPVLELDDGTMLTENTAIAAYLEAFQPEPVLLGRNAKEKGLVANWNARCEYEGIAAVAEAFRNSTPGFKDRSVNGPTPFPQLEELVERGKIRTLEFFETLNRRLENREYLAIDQFSMADITAIVMVDFAKWVKLEVPAKQSHLKRWYAAVSERPAVKLE